MSIILVIPCYNEGRRLDEAAFLSLLPAEPELRLLFVDDGSNDNTAARLQTLVARSGDRAQVLTLRRHSGKAEAVRQGLLRALADGADVTGYVDADLATPVSEIRRLLAILRGGTATVLLASRVGLLGRSIERKAVRHYIGRVFATAAALTLRLRVYDTQCGAKLFRRTGALEAALATPFLSSWIFDVELLGRMIIGGPEAAPLGPGEIVEEPLLIWKDVAGSRLNPLHGAVAARDMLRVALDLSRRRRESRSASPRPPENLHG